MEIFEIEELVNCENCRKAKMRKYFLVQKLIGVLCIALTILSAILIQDVTIGCLFVPLGLYLMFTKEKVFHENRCYFIDGKEA